MPRKASSKSPARERPSAGVPSARELAPQAPPRVRTASSHDTSPNVYDDFVNALGRSRVFRPALNFIATAFGALWFFVWMPSMRRPEDAANSGALFEKFDLWNPSKEQTEAVSYYIVWLVMICILDDVWKSIEQGTVPPVSIGSPQ